MVKIAQNAAAYFHQSRFQSIPIMIEIIKNTATKEPMIISERESRAVTEAVSVGTATFNLVLSQSIGKAVAIGNTNVVIRMMRSNARFFGRLCRTYACTK